MHDVDILLDDPRAARAGPAPLARWWQSLPGAARAPVWPRIIGLLVVAALLITFHQVVRDAVRQGELLRMSIANRAEAAWRCNTLTRAHLRATCLAQIESPPPARPVDASPPPNTAALSLAGVHP